MDASVFPTGFSQITNLSLGLGIGFSAVDFGVVDFPVEFLEITGVISQLEDFTFSGNVIEVPEGVTGPTNINLLDVTFTSNVFPVNLSGLSNTQQLSINAAAGTVSVASLIENATLPNINTLSLTNLDFTG